MRPSDVELSRLALAWGWLDPEDFRRCLREADHCQAIGLEKGIDEILLEEHRLSREQIRRLRHHLGWSLERSRIGGFEILRRIGVGGSGSVFEARQVRLNQRVALKVLYPRYAKNQRMRSLFLRETRALARLNHPHLVHAFDGGRDGKYHYLAMEYVEGENLLQRLTREGPLSVSRSIEIVKAICSALTALEARRLVHRDIKPANILLTADGGVKLADLGLLKVETDSEAPAAEWLCGTPHYLSPEQARGDGKEDIRSDLYSLGATWYHALAGRPPFVGGSSREIIVAHQTREPAPLKRYRDGIPPAVERTVLSWLSKDPGLRPATSHKAIEELERLSRAQRAGRLTGLPVGRWALIAGTLLVACALGIWMRPGGSASMPDAVPASSAPAHELSGRALPSPSTGAGDHEAFGPPPPVRDDRAELIDGSVTPTASDSRGRREASPVNVHPPLELTSIFRSIQRRLREGARVFESEPGWLPVDPRPWLERIPAARARFDTLAPLRRSFHAPRASLAPIGEDDALVLLEYEFVSHAELDDFRARPGSVRVRDGELISASDAFGTTIESVAWFSRPVRLCGEVSPDARISLGFGDLRVSPWADRAAPAGAESHGVDAFREAAGAFDLRLDGARVYLRAGARTGVEDRAVPERGRLTITIDAGRLRWLRIEAHLEMRWAVERLRWIEDP